MDDWLINFLIMMMESFFIRRRSEHCYIFSTWVFVLNCFSLVFWFQTFYSLFWPQVSEKLGKVYSEMIFVHGFVHCDPHPGNVLIQKCPNSRKTQIVLLDHGLYQVGTFLYRTVWNLWSFNCMLDPSLFLAFKWVSVSHQWASFKNMFLLLHSGPSA